MRTAITTIALTAALTLTAHGEYVTAKEGLRVRSKPNLEAEIVKVVPFGEEVEGTITNGWMQTADGFLKASFLSANSPLDQYEYQGTWLLTAYTHSGNPCFNGEYPEPGYTVACNSLKIGTEIFIRGIGFRVVTDRGPASMPSEWCDIFMDGYDEAVTFGEQYHDVYIVKGVQQ